MTGALEDSLIDLLIQRLAAETTSAGVVGWATEAIVAGVETPSLLILAGLDRSSSVFETMPWLDKALRELNVPQLPPNELRRAFVGVVSRRLLAGRMTPEQALDSVHRHSVSPLGHPDDLSAWCHAWEGHDPTTFSELSSADVDRTAHQLAARWATDRGLF